MFACWIKHRHNIARCDDSDEDDDGDDDDDDDDGDDNDDDGGDQHCRRFWTLHCCVDIEYKDCFIVSYLVVERIYISNGYVPVFVLLDVQHPHKQSMVCYMSYFTLLQLNVHTAH